jgi:hypothetical protein
VPEKARKRKRKIRDTINFKIKSMLLKELKCTFPPSWVVDPKSNNVKTLAACWKA